MGHHGQPVRNEIAQGAQKGKIKQDSDNDTRNGTRRFRSPALENFGHIDIHTITGDSTSSEAQQFGEKADHVTPYFSRNATSAFVPEQFF